MARTATGHRFFAVKVWYEWLPEVDGEGHVELCLLLVRASGPDEARRVAWTLGLGHHGFEAWFDGEPVKISILGTDHLFDTGRDTLEDFDDDPLVFTHLFPVRNQWIDFYDPARLVRPDALPGPQEMELDLPDFEHLDGNTERWFGAKVWRTWTAGDDDRFFEEVVLVVRARSKEGAGERATELAIAADTDVVNDAGELLHVRTVNLDHVFDVHSPTVIDRYGSEVFGQLFSLNPDGSVEFYDSDNDLPFREYALGWDRPLPGEDTEAEPPPVAPVIPVTPADAEELAGATPDWFAEVVRLQRDGDSDEESESLWALIHEATFTPKEAYAAASAHLGSDDPAERGAAVHVLGQLGYRRRALHEPSAQDLINAATQETDSDVQWALARAFGYLGHPDSLDVLVQLARHERYDIRFQVAAALPRAGSTHRRDEAMRLLVALSEDPDPSVREEARRAIAELSPQQRQ